MLKMKLISGYWAQCIFIILISGCWQMAAQEHVSKSESKEIRVKKHTVLAQYEPELVVPADERLQLKNDRLNTIRERRAIIDTLTLSDRKRRKLLKELYRSPFSNHWDKLIADIEAEEEEDIEDQP